MWGIFFRRPGYPRFPQPVPISHQLPYSTSYSAVLFFPVFASIRPCPSVAHALAFALAAPPSRHFSAMNPAHPALCGKRASRVAQVASRSAFWTPVKSRGLPPPETLLRADRRFRPRRKGSLCPHSPFRICTSLTKLPQPLYNPHLQEPCASVGKKGAYSSAIILSTPFLSTLTSIFRNCDKHRAYNPFGIRTYKKGVYNPFKIRTSKKQGVGGGACGNLPTRKPYLPQTVRTPWSVPLFNYQLSTVNSPFKSFRSTFLPTPRP